MSTRLGVAGLPSPHPLGRSLPAVYQEDDFAQSLLRALDEVLAPVISTIDNLDAYLDPRLAPDDFVTWLAGWVGIAGDDSWDADRRREAVASAAELYRLRGTAAGLARQIEIHTGGTVEITENGGTAWSIDAGGEIPGSAKPLVVVRVVVDDPDSVDRARLNALIAAAKPAHVEHRFEVVKAGGRRPAASGQGSSGQPPASTSPAPAPDSQTPAE